MKRTASKESIHAMWHDPSTYNHVSMGPPYLPGQAIEPKPMPRPLSAKVASDAGPEAELATLLAMLRALGFMHQTHHWLSKGSSFYGDHQLFDRLYTDTLPMIDSLAERCVGFGGEVLIGAVRQAETMTTILGALASPEGSSPDGMVLSSLKGVEAFLEYYATCYAALESRGQLSSGTDNLLQGIADKSEEFVYLLKQRSSSKVASYAR